MQQACGNSISTHINSITNGEFTNFMSNKLVEEGEAHKPINEWKGFKVGIPHWSIYLQFKKQNKNTFEVFTYLERNGMKFTIVPFCIIFTIFIRD